MPSPTAAPAAAGRCGRGGRVLRGRGHDLGRRRPRWCRGRGLGGGGVRRHDRRAGGHRGRDGRCHGRRRPSGSGDPGDVRRRDGTDRRRRHRRGRRRHRRARLGAMDPVDDHPAHHQERPGGAQAGHGDAGDPGRTTAAHGAARHAVVQADAGRSRSSTCTRSRPSQPWAAPRPTPPDSTPAATTAAMAVAARLDSPVRDIRSCVVAVVTPGGSRRPRRFLQRAALYVHLIDGSPALDDLSAALPPLGWPRAGRPIRVPVRPAPGAPRTAGSAFVVRSAGTTIDGGEEAR